jgi:beta-glucanase (GH16 family)
LLKKAMKRTQLLCLLLFITVRLFSQTITFPSGTVLCDGSPWKLVFYDEFNGTGLDTTKWKPYYYWDGGPSNWVSQRFYHNAILRDDNIDVSGGICHMKMWSLGDTVQWHCDACYGETTYYSHYTSSWLSTLWDVPYVYGKFEIRAKMSIATKAHSAIWLWDGGAPANEIDIVEGYGDPYWTNRRTTSALHQGSDAITNLLPHNSFWDHIWGTLFNIGDWHTYACEWDSTEIRFYVDGGLYHKEERYCGGTVSTDALLPELATYSVFAAVGIEGKGVSVSVPTSNGGMRSTWAV